MSYVTNVLLHVGILEEVTLDQINATASEQEGQRLLDISKPDEHWGGNKHPEATIYAAAFNYLREDEFKAHLAGLPWACPEDVQLFIQGQHDEKFTVFELQGREWFALRLPVAAQ